jgi:hypothetical protein
MLDHSDQRQLVNSSHALLVKVWAGFTLAPGAVNLAAAASRDCSPYTVVAVTTIYLQITVVITIINIVIPAGLPQPFSVGSVVLLLLRKDPTAVRAQPDLVHQLHLRINGL